MASFQQPHVASDAEGNAIAVWQDHDGSHYSIWANRYTAAGGWGGANPLEFNDTVDARYPQVAFVGGGDAVALWLQDLSPGSTAKRIWVNWYHSGLGWGRPEKPNVTGWDSPRLAANGGGSAVLVWRYNNNIWASRYVAGTGWGAPEGIESNNLSLGGNLQAAVDSGGNATVVWTQWDGTASRVWANRYVVGSGWGGPEVIETNIANSTDPQVAADASGNVLAVWTEIDGTDSIWANRYSAGSGWGTAERIETNNSGNAETPQVATGPDGDAVAVWAQYDATRANIWSNRYVAGSGWGTAVLIETDNSGNASVPQVDVDGSGNAVAVWDQADVMDFRASLRSIWGNRYTAGAGWGTAALLETWTDVDGYGRYPEVAVDLSGNAVTAWFQFDGGSVAFIAANFFVEGYAPALSLVAPGEGFSSNRSTVWVSGTAEAGATLVVNGLVASLAANGSFGLWVSLSPGPNLIQATARDRAGNGASVFRNVTYSDPLPALEAELATATADLVSVQAELAAAQANLSAIQTDLGSAEASLETMRSNLSSTQFALDGARNDLAQAQARVAVLEANGNATEAELEAARADLGVAQADVASLETRLNSTMDAVSEAQANVTSLAAAQAAAQTRVAALETELLGARLNATMAQSQIAALDARLAAMGKDLAATNEALNATKANAEGGSATDTGLATAAIGLAVLGIAAGAAGVAMGMRTRRPESHSQPPERPPTNP